jgi:hypothetical protein
MLGGSARALYLFAWLAGCPDTGGFEVVPPVDAGVDARSPEADAGPGTDSGPATDAGPDGAVACTEPLLRCTRSCDGLFDSVLLEPDFASFPSSLRVAAGTVRVEGGELVFERDSSESFSSVSTQGQYSDALLCARIRMPGGGEGVSLNMFAVGWLTGSGGVELFLEGRNEQVTFHSLEVLPDGVLLGRRDHVWEADHEFLVLAWFSGEDAYAEVFDTTMDVAFALRGTYRGEPPPALGWLSATEPKLLEPVRLQRLVIGIPSGDALAVMQR